MTKLFQFTQFFPVALFLYFSRRHSWDMGFQIGGLAAAAEFLILMAKRIPLSRLIGGANLFLIFGGISFFFNIKFFLEILSQLMETAIFISIFIVISLAIILTKTAAFERPDPQARNIKKYSYILIVFVAICIAWSFYFRGDTNLAGTVPFLCLISLKYYLQQRLINSCLIQ